MLAETLADLLDEQTNWQYERSYLVAMAEEILLKVANWLVLR
jgi:hypothetical protein